MLRISGGLFRGITLSVPSALRPTEAKVRQAIFNILGDFVQDARVLDGFAGSGALGCEALSRGASFVAFIESDPEAMMAIRDNVTKIDPELPAHVTVRYVQLEVERGLRMLAKEKRPFDIILLDPPYRSPEAKNALNTVVECAILAPTGVMVIEHHRGTLLPATMGVLHQQKQHRYGNTVLSLYQAADL